MSARPSCRWLPTEIWHGGQIVAVVLAETFEAAREAAHRLEVTYAAEQPSAELRQRRARRRSPPRTSSSNYEDPAVGDAEAAFAGAPVKIDAALRDADPASQSDRAVHHELRLGRRQADGVGVAARTSPASRTASPSSSASTRTKIHVVSPFIGGAFGSRGSLTQRTALIARRGAPAEPAGQAGRRPATRASRSPPTAPRRATTSGSAPAATASSWR